MTAVEATAVPGGTVEPAHCIVTVTDAPAKPEAEYGSNFGAGFDGWDAGNVDTTIDRDTSTFPTRLVVQAPITSNAVALADRSVTGLTTDAAYVLSVLATRTKGQVRLRVRTTADVEVAVGPWLAPQDPATKLTLDFVAPDTTVVLELQIRYSATTLRYGERAEYRFHGINVFPGAWPGTVILRTDVNGTDVPVYNPKGLDVEDNGDGTGGLTLADYECALLGPISYRVMDGTGGEAVAVTAFTPSRRNGVTNPAAPGVDTTDPWAGVGCTLTADPLGAIVGTLTSSAATDLAQRLQSPTDTLTAWRCPVPAGQTLRVSALASATLAEIAGSTPSFAEVMQPAKFAGASPTLSLTVAPQPGDLFVVWVTHFNTAAGNPTVAGVGATWAKLDPPAGHAESNASHSSFWFVGEGANTTGTVTVTLPSGRNGILRGWLIRGLGAHTINRTATARVGVTAGGTLASPVQQAQGGQVVIQAALSSTDSGLSITGQAPASGYTAGNTIGSLTAGSRTTARRVASELTPTSHSFTVSSSTAATLMAEQLVIGNASSTVTPPANVKARVTFRDASGATISTQDTPVELAPSPQEVTLDTVVPGGTEYVDLGIGLAGTTARTVGDTLTITGPIYLGPVGDPFTGYTADTPTEAHSWAGDPHASESVAVALGTSEVAPSLTIPGTALASTNLSPPEFAPLTMVIGYEEVSESNGAIVFPIGSTRNLPSPRGALRDRTGTLDLFCVDYTAARAVRDLLKDGDYVLLRQSTFRGFDLLLYASRVALRPAPEATNTRRWVASVTYTEVPR